MRYFYRYIVFLLFLASNDFALAKAENKEDKSYVLYGTITKLNNNQPIKGVEIYINQSGKSTKTDKRGQYKIHHLKPGKYTLLFFYPDFEQVIREVEIIDKNVSISVALKSIELELSQVSVLAKSAALNDGKNYLNAVENTAIYAAQKTEVALVEEIAANKSTNSARQIFAATTGIQVWESDGAGLQLGIGGRGLSPNRTANFNTRQNGYDMSADALGYPESYYSPPMEAVEKIEIIRGAASIQYGPQFGGLVNFILHKGSEDKPLEVVHRSTIGSFSLFNSFTSIGGTKGKWNYYSFYQRKYGDGWRANSGFGVNTAYINLNYKINDKGSLGFDYTFMDYTAQQPGGLTDEQFLSDPRQSQRARNWFNVNWNMAAFIFDYKLSSKTKLNSRTFGLFASRQALGNLGKINRPDHDGQRDLIVGQFKNWGSELRLLHKYKFIMENQAFLIGARFYDGNTHSQQGYASASSEADFNFLNPDDPGISDFRFPSKNASFFTSNLIRLNKQLSVVPGARFEYIQTASSGYFNEIVTHPLTGQILLSDTSQEHRYSARSILLYGLGTSYQISKNHKWYANYSRNYKSITFSDMQIVNPNFKIDENLKDETGYNFELGTRGKFKKYLGYDINVFYLHYNDRIGAVLEKDPADGVLKRIRKNIADSRNRGVESYVECDIWKLVKPTQDDLSWILFSNVSFIDAKYINSQETAFEGKVVENVPNWNIKGGMNFKRKSLKIGLQYNYISKQYTDATNAIEPIASAIYGEIPAYGVFDVSTNYVLKNNITIETGINNITNNMYFTRRAAGYPGPGIIPSDGRNFYLTLQLIF